jgi:hypothetical protein
MLKSQSKGGVYTTEILIKGKRKEYHGCSSKSLEEAKEYYKNNETYRWKYIGSGTTYFVNGIRNESKEIMHCFIKIPRKRKVLK